MSGDAGLHMAVVAGDADLVRRLISERADVNEEDDDSPPLFKAAGLDSPEIARALLASQADVNWRGSEFSFTALHQAVCLNNSKMIEALVDCKADVHLVDEGGSSALSLAMSVQKRLEADLEEAEQSEHVCTRELERQTVMCDMAKNSRIREVLEAAGQRAEDESPDARRSGDRTAGQC
eukprot:s3229_g11.t1